MLEAKGKVNFFVISVTKHLGFFLKGLGVLAGVVACI